MALGPHVAEWTALQNRLRALRHATSAHLVGVISTGNVLWCASRTEADVDSYAGEFYRASIALLESTSSAASDSTSCNA